ncbi:methyl-accepting chemotaxis protein [Vibrio ulleungensis]|uniref:Methyl-accepting chemotaxis protein n=1 Tax=Vibrio ulleungensis TaxID=2807619 RepID=A0ABS2HLI9_9VIBR|nr:methyl-accepting chemotaxis protein [Vibrio ulleungensis]MBM7037447.1 methyl-accepting chemotaxis protein [Vibrio ulleungensis]
MQKMTFKPWQKVITDVRFTNKMVLLMVLSTILLVLKQTWDASLFHSYVLEATSDPVVAQEFYVDYVKNAVLQTGGLLVIFCVVLLGAAKLLNAQFTYLQESISHLANQDLTKPIIMDCKDEFGDVARNLEKMRVTFSDTIRAQRDSSEETKEMTSVMTNSMAETKQASEEEYGQIEMLATAMSEMAQTVQTVADNARGTSDVTKSAATQAETGQRFVQDTVAKMTALSKDISQSAGAVNQVEERVEAISSVVGTIQGISEQTNLLALNAAIEAARAGDAGRGFAVVADEVRKLAQSTQQATVEIQDMITQLQDSANRAVGLMEKSVVDTADSVDLVSSAGGELDGIVEQVNQINDMNYQVATTAEQQSTVAEEMSRNVEKVKEIVEITVITVSELEESSHFIQKGAEELNSRVSRFAV